MKRISLLSISICLVMFVCAGWKQQPGIDKATMTRGEAVYKTQCLSCHQIDGGGVPHLNPPLAECSYVVGDKSRIIKIVLKGMIDRVEIDGEFYGNNMSPHNDLTNQQIADVLTYVRNSFGNKASAVTVAEVKAVREGKSKK
ncbi:c-type cytochrome [Chitinophagaceae bacterium LWZ2-11]